MPDSKDESNNNSIFLPKSKFLERVGEREDKAQGWQARTAVLHDERVELGELGCARSGGELDAGFASSGPVGNGVKVVLSPLTRTSGFSFFLL